MKLKDCFWLWGQDAMSHQNSLGNATWKLPGGNKLGPAEGAQYLGIPNMCRVVMCGNPQPPFDEETRKLTAMKKVIWSAIGDSGSHRNDAETDLEEVIRQAQMFPNVKGAVFDDFFGAFGEPNVTHWARYSVEEVRRIKDRLHNSPAGPLDLWVVWYQRGLDYPIDDYLKEFDVITYWNMNTPAHHHRVEEDLARMVERTPGKRRLTGCYIWNYGAGRPLTIPEIKFECETFYNMIKSGKSEGIIFCSNCCADVGGPAVDWLRNWIKEAGEEEI